MSLADLAFAPSEFLGTEWAVLRRLGSVASFPVGKPVRSIPTDMVSGTQFDSVRLISDCREIWQRLLRKGSRRHGGTQKHVSARATHTNIQLLA
jgi:hypothetical protein